MDFLAYTVRKLIYGVPLVLGVSFVSFVLMVYFGPDLTYQLVGRNPTAEQIARAHEILGYNQPFVVRYVDYLRELVTLDFGRSFSTGERVADLLARTVPVSLLLTLPGFVIGNLLGIGLALVAGWFRGGLVDKAIMAGSVVGMSISFLIVIIAFQLFFSSPYGLNYFPVRGWEARDRGVYVFGVTMTTLALIFLSLGYNTRFFRAVVVEEMSRDHILTARAYGATPFEILFKHVLTTCMIPIITRL